MSKCWGHINITQNKKQKFEWFGLIVEKYTLSESKKYDKMQMYPQCYNIPLLFYIGKKYQNLHFLGLKSTFQFNLDNSYKIN